MLSFFSFMNFVSNLKRPVSMFKYKNEGGQSNYKALLFTFAPTLEMHIIHGHAVLYSSYRFYISSWICCSYKLVIVSIYIKIALHTPQYFLIIL